MSEFNTEGWNRGVARAKSLLDEMIANGKDEQLPTLRKQIADACSGPDDSEALGFVHALLTLAKAGNTKRSLAELGETLA